MPTIGIHTRTVGDGEREIGRSHAWITIKDKDSVRNFSSYPDNQQFRGVRGLEEGQPAKTTVIEGLDRKSISTTSLYKEISEQEAIKCHEKIDEPRTYSRHRNNCSHFASDVWEHTTGEKLGVTHQVGQGPLGGPVDSPVGLEKFIRGRELDQATEKLEIASALTPVSADRPSGQNAQAIPAWKAKWASYVEKTKIPDPAPSAAESDTLKKSKGRSR